MLSSSTPEMIFGWDSCTATQKHCKPRLGTHSQWFRPPKTVRNIVSPAHATISSHMDLTICYNRPRWVNPDQNLLYIYIQKNIVCICHTLNNEVLDPGQPPKNQGHGWWMLMSELQSSRSNAPWAAEWAAGPREGKITLANPLWNKWWLSS